MQTHLRCVQKFHQVVTQQSLAKYKTDGLPFLCETLELFIRAVDHGHSVSPPHLCPSPFPRHMTWVASLEPGSHHRQTFKMMDVQNPNSVI